MSRGEERGQRINSDLGNTTLVPGFLRIHGGGFVIGSPAMDKSFSVTAVKVGQESEMINERGGVRERVKRNSTNEVKEEEKREVE